MATGRALKDVYIVAAKRTPFGTYLGKISHLTPTDLLEIATKAALLSAKIDPKIVSSTVVGNVYPSVKDTTYIARHVSIRVGIPYEKPAYGVNRLCGSSFQSIVNASQEVVLGDSEIVIAGGSESMSTIPHAVSGIRSGVKFMQDIVLEDRMWQTLIDQQFKMPMGVTAENLAEKYGLTRQNCDEFALSSQQRWQKANDEGRFKAEMAPITIETKKGNVSFEVDEHPRGNITLEALAKLPPVFKKGGVTTAGNSSGICDGAACVIVASGDACKKYSLTPLARIAAYGIAGCDPKIMGIGPVPAVQALLKAAAMSLSKVDLVEVNEAFAAQYLSVEKELGLDRAKTNINGGAIALGHPVGASGGRITSHLVHEMKRQKVKYSIGSACIGGGQGIALLLENI